MIDKVPKNKCFGCKACFNVCTVKCIKMIIDSEGFWYPEVNNDRCTGCGLCEEVCPEINEYTNMSAYKKPLALAAWNNNKQQREGSSSGGIFTVLAEWIITEGGVVYGAGYDYNFNVKHKGVDTAEGLKELRGSKYVQSDIDRVYSEVKENLESGKEVLFTGTPCQIAGLYNYLWKKEYQNLYTCDIVCHGVPSPGVFDSYKNWLEEYYGSRLKDIDFRDKRSGWKHYSVSTEFENNKEYTKTYREDIYMNGFLKDIYLRPSCYSCKYTGIPRTADITLGDFWGVAINYPELDDDKGTSLLLINTDKGKQMLEICKDSMFFQECKLEYALKGNPCIVKPVNEPKARERFFRDLNHKGFNYVVRKYMSPPSWIKRKLVGIRKRLGL